MQCSYILKVINFINCVLLCSYLQYSSGRRLAFLFNMSEGFIFMSYAREPNTDTFVKKLKSDLDTAGFKYGCVA